MSTLGVWEMWSTPFLPLLSGPPKHGLVVPVRALSKDQIELFDHLQRIIFTPCEFFRSAFVDGLSLESE